MEDLAARMRQLEHYHTLRALGGVWLVIRVDGRGFSRVADRHFERPFDPRFHELMVETAKALLREFQGLYAYTQSDEISVAFPPSWEMFDRSLEKLVSLSAGLSSATFSHGAGFVAQFDSRVWLGPTVETAQDYFRWRQVDAARCSLNAWCYWTLRKEGLTRAAATKALHGATSADKNELLFARGINFNELPEWQRRGVGLHWSDEEREGWDPQRQRATLARRRGIRVDEALPIREEYTDYLGRVLALRAEGPPGPR